MRDLRQLILEQGDTFFVIHFISRTCFMKSINIHQNSILLTLHISFSLQQSLFPTSMNKYRDGSNFHWKKSLNGMFTFPKEQKFSDHPDTNENYHINLTDL